jgi:MerR HTH family regulatory protein
MSEDLMTRRQVASMFRVTSAAVATWARRGRLPEIRNEAGRPRYRRADVEALFRAGFRRGRPPAPGSLAPAPGSLAPAPGSTRASALPDHRRGRGLGEANRTPNRS